MPSSYLQPGDTLTVTNSTGVAIAAGAGILVGTRVAVAMVDLAIAASGSAMFTGVHNVTKSVAAGSGGAQGAAVYWDNTAKNFTAVVTANTLAGYFAETVADAVATCKVKLLS